eukprot:gene31-biopygen6045
MPLCCVPGTSSHVQAKDRRFATITKKRQEKDSVLRELQKARAKRVDKFATLVVYGHATKRQALPLSCVSGAPRHAFLSNFSGCTFSSPFTTMSFFNVTRCSFSLAVSAQPRSLRGATQIQSLGCTPHFQKMAQGGLWSW